MKSSFVWLAWTYWCHTWQHPLVFHQGNDMTSAQYREAGIRLATFMNLKVGGPNNYRYPTDWGTKTAEGLGRCMERILKQAVEAVPEQPETPQLKE